MIASMPHAIIFAWKMEKNTFKKSVQVFKLLKTSSTLHSNRATTFYIFSLINLKILALKSHGKGKQEVSQCCRRKSKSDDFFKSKTNGEDHKAKPLDFVCKILHSLCAFVALRLLLRVKLQIKCHERSRLGRLESKNSAAENQRHDRKSIQE